MTNKYLEKIALTRLVKEIAKNPGKFNPKKLSELGALRTLRTYVKGLKNGNEVLSYKLKSPISNTLSPNGNNYATNLLNEDARKYIAEKSKLDINSIIYAKKPETSFDIARGGGTLMHNSSNSRHVNNLHHELGIRHELHEAKSFINSNHDNVNTGIFKTLDFKPSGTHHRPSVLLHESNDIRALPYKKELLPYMRLRKITGESGVIKSVTGKNFGSDKMTKVDMNKLDSTPHNFFPGTELSAYTDNPLFRFKTKI